MRISLLAFGFCHLQDRATAIAASDACELEQVDGRTLTAKDFKQLYRSGNKHALGKPVVLRNLMDTWKLSEQDWTIEGFAAAFGDVALDFDDVNPAVSGYEQFNATTIGQSLLAPNASRKAVWFMRAQHELSQRLESLMSIPEPLIDVQMVGPQVSIGLEGHGGEFNIHAENWLAQVAGTKRWMLLQKDMPRPAYATDEIDTHPCSYSERQKHLQSRERERTPVYECELAQGDIIYVPHQWAHATCNLGSGLNLALGFIASVDHLPPPHLAAITGNMTLLETLIEEEVNMVDRKTGETPMHLAAASGRPSAIESLLRQRASVNVRDKEGATPVHTAAMFGQAGSVSTLAAARAAVNAINHAARQPIFIAAHDGHAKAVQALLEVGARTDGKTKNKQATRPLLGSIPYGHVSTAALLISARAGVEPPALRDAAREGHGQLVELFLQHRADVAAVTDGRQALHDALGESGSREVIKALLEAGANIHAMSELGETGVQLAAMRGPEYEQLLASYGVVAPLPFSVKACCALLFTLSLLVGLLFLKKSKTA